MGQRKAILVPVDFTDAARHAVINAIELGKQLESDVFLINFIPPGSTGGKAGFADKSEALFSSINLLRENQMRLGELLKCVDTSGVSVHSEIKIDSLSEGIKKQFRIKDIELMVIGISEAHTIGDFFCQNRSCDAAIPVDCPIMICKNQTYEFSGRHNIVVSLDLDLLRNSNFDLMASIASKLSSKIYCMHVNQPTDRQRLTYEDLARYLQQHKLKANAIDIIESSNKEGAINTYAEKRKANFIAVNEFSRSYQHKPSPESLLADENLVFVY